MFAGIDRYTLIDATCRVFGRVREAGPGRARGEGGGWRGSVGMKY